MTDLRKDNFTYCFVIDTDIIVHEFSLGLYRRHKYDFPQILLVTKNNPSKLDKNEIYCDFHTNLIKYLKEINL